MSDRARFVYNARGPFRRFSKRTLGQGKGIRRPLTQARNSACFHDGIRLVPLLGKVFHRCKRTVDRRWRMDETYIKIKGQWKYLYRAVDSDGQTIDFLLTAKRDAAAALRFFRKAIRQHVEPEVGPSIKAAQTSPPSRS